MTTYRCPQMFFDMMRGASTEAEKQIVRACVVEWMALLMLVPGDKVLSPNPVNGEVEEFVYNPTVN